MPKVINNEVNDPVRCHFADPKLIKNKVFKSLNKKNPIIDDIKKVCPLIKDKDLSLQKTRANSITTLSIIDEKTHAETKIHIYKPSRFKRLISKKEPFITFEFSTANENNIKLVAQIAGGVSCSCDIIVNKSHPKDLGATLLKARDDYAQAITNQNISAYKKLPSKNQLTSQAKIDEKVIEKAKEKKPKTSIISRAANSIKAKFKGREH